MPKYSKMPMLCNNRELHGSQFVLLCFSVFCVLAPMPVHADNVHRSFYSVDTDNNYPEPAVINRVDDFKAALDAELANSLPLAVSAAGERSNGAIRFDILSAKKLQRIQSLTAPDGEVFLSLRVRITNVHEKGLVSKDALAGKQDAARGVVSPFGGEVEVSENVELDYTVVIKSLAQHFYLMANGIAYSLKSEMSMLDDVHSPNSRIEIERQGQSQDVTLLFSVPAGDEDFALQYLDYNIGHIVAPVSGDPANAVGTGTLDCPVATMQHPLVDLCVVSIDELAQFEGYQAKEGKRLLGVQLSAISLAKNGGEGAILTVDPSQYLWLKDSEDHFASSRALEKGDIQFPPDIRSTQIVVFEVSNEFNPGKLVLQLGNDVVEASFEAETTPSSADAFVQYEDDDKMRVSLFGITQAENYFIVDIGIQSLQQELRVPVNVNRRFFLVTDDKPVSIDSRASEQLAYGISRSFEIPPAQNFRFKIAFQLDEKPTLFKFVGFHGTEEFDLSGLEIPASDESTLTALNNVAFSEDAESAVTDTQDSLITAADQNASPVLDNQIVDNPTLDNNERLAEMERSLSNLPSLDIQPKNGISLFEEIEPNDSRAVATDLGSQTGEFRIGGTFTPPEGRQSDNDIYSFTVSGEPQLWFFSVTGTPVQNLYISDPSGNIKFDTRRSGQSDTLVVPNALLPSGQYFVQIRTQDPRDTTASIDYELVATPLGPATLSSEKEPNNGELVAERLSYGNVRSGFLADKYDKDVYSITIDAEIEKVAFVVKPAEKDKLRVQVYQRIPGGSTISFGRLEGAIAGDTLRGTFSLTPGTYVFTLSAIESGEELAPYQILLNRLNRYTEIADLEPNDTIKDAKPLPQLLSFTGEIAGSRDIDWYKMPEGSERITIRSINVSDDKNAGSIRASFTNSAGRRTSNLYWNEELQATEGELDGENTVFLTISGAGAYEVTRSNELLTERNPDLPVKLDIESPDKSLGSFIEKGQRLNVPIRLTNQSAQDETLTLNSAINSQSWVVQDMPDTIKVPANGFVDSVLSVNVAPDIPASESTLIDVQINDGLGRSLAASANLSSSCDAAASDVYDYWSIPNELRGGLNVGSSLLGAEPLGNDSFPENLQSTILDRQLRLISENGNVDRPWRVKLSDEVKDENVVLKLAGDEPSEIVGAIFKNPATSNISETPADVEIQLSLNNVDFQTAWRGSIPVSKQSFNIVFDDPVTAHFARMIIKSTSRNGGHASLDRWKTIAKPGSNPLGEQSINIASIESGGHLVSASNTQLLQGMRSIITEQTRRARDSVEQEADTQDDWVLGFHEQRTAKLSAIKWENLNDPELLLKAPLPSTVKVQASLQTPLGPWTDIGEFTFNPVSTDTALLQFKEPVWARYIRFVVPETEEEREWSLPQSIEIMEEIESENYLSIAGEWGDDSSKSYYEMHHSPAITQQASGIPANTTKSKATDMPFQTPIANRVLLGSYENWYLIDVAHGQNRLGFSVTGNPAITMQFKLTDAESKPVELKKDTQARGELELTAIVEPGRYYLQVFEPPRSIVITWDTSGSVSRYLQTIQEAVLHFVQQVQPEYEFVNLMPFARTPTPLLPEFSDNAAELATVFRQNDIRENSSDAEGNLLGAIEAMEERPGTKAVVILTDGQSGSSSSTTVSLWNKFDEVRPRIFTLEIHSGSNAFQQQDKMQNWAAAQSGHYSKFSTDEELRHGFARASCHLRRPAAYTIVAEPFNEAPAEPGGIRLIAAAGTEAPTELSGTDALEIVLDASGSMHKKLGDTTRLKVAQEILSDLVTTVIPEGTPVALRIFGHREASTCRTDLEVGLGPANPARLAEAINNTNAQPYAKTPIAQSLALVAEDLALVEGAKNVILVTDGEESCDGDPAEAITQLRQAGFDVRINIVGFAIDDEELKQSFTDWATLGGGEYFDAPDAASLKTGLQSALQQPFEVVDGNDAVVASGIIGGDTVTIPAGEYTVNVLSEPAIQLKNVKIDSGKTTTLSPQPNLD